MNNIHQKKKILKQCGPKNFNENLNHKSYVCDLDIEVK